MAIALPSVAGAKTVEDVVDIVENLRKDVEFYFNTLGSEGVSANKIQVGNSTFDMSANEIKLSVVELKAGISNMQASIDIQADQIQSKVSADYVNEQLAPVYTDIDGHEQRIKSAESSITQNANNIALKVSQTDFNGNTIGTLINMDTTTVTIKGSKINLVGAVTVLSDITNNLGSITAGELVGIKWKSLNEQTPFDVFVGGDTHRSMRVFNGSLRLEQDGVEYCVISKTGGLTINGSAPAAKFG